MGGRSRGRGLRWEIDGKIDIWNFWNLKLKLYFSWKFSQVSSHESQLPFPSSKSEMHRDDSRLRSDEQASSQNYVWAFLSQLIFIVIFSRSRAIRVTFDLQKRRFKSEFLGKAQPVETRLQIDIYLFSLSFSQPHQPSNKFCNNNYPIHFYALIWWNRNGRAINFIQLNCIICITNTLIEKWIRYLTRLSLLGPFECTYRHLRKICDTKNKSLMNNECALETERARAPIPTFVSEILFKSRLKDAKMCDSRRQFKAWCHLAIKPLAVFEIRYGFE